MDSTSVRRVLAVKPDGPWLVVVDGAWTVESPNAETDAPFERSRVWLFPLLERSRDEVESEARQLLGPNDPNLAEALQAVVQRGLTAWSDYWISRTLPWIVADEIELFAELLREIALGRRGSQATQHAAKQLLKENELWPTSHCRPSQPIGRLRGAILGPAALLPTTLQPFLGVPSDHTTGTELVPFPDRISSSDPARPDQLHLDQCAWSVRLERHGTAVNRN
jgi:hypothetical protein